MKEAQIVGRYPQLADLYNFSLQKYEKENDIQCEGNPTISFAILQSLVRRRVGSISWCNGNMAFPTFMTQFISFIVLLFIITPIIFTLLLFIIHMVQLVGQKKSIYMKIDMIQISNHYIKNVLIIHVQTN